MNWKQAQHEHDNELPSETEYCELCEEDMTNANQFESIAGMMCEYCFESYDTARLVKLLKVQVDNGQE